MATTHGQSHTALYRIWRGMISRCERPSSENYRHYGGRGIRVCKRWRKSFTDFASDMGPRPSAAHSIDRIDNDGNYEPGNCRWATNREQHANTRVAVNLEFEGTTLCLSEWARRTGISVKTISGRINSGWSVRAALTTAPAPREHRHSHQGKDRYREFGRVHSEFVRRGERVRGSKLTESSVREIRALHASGTSLVDIAARFGVVPSTVGFVISGQTWRHVSSEESQ